MLMCKSEKSQTIAESNKYKKGESLFCDGLNQQEFANTWHAKHVAC